MYILITYDVNTEEKAGNRRLSRVARLCKDYGIRVQNSVFECVLTEVQLTELHNKLEGIIDTQKDTIRIYFLNRNNCKRVIKMGRDSSVDFEGTLIL